MLWRPILYMALLQTDMKIIHLSSTGHPIWPPETGSSIGISLLITIQLKLELGVEYHENSNVCTQVIEYAGTNGVPTLYVVVLDL